MIQILVTSFVSLGRAQIYVHMLIHDLTLVVIKDGTPICMYVCRYFTTTVKQKIKCHDNLVLHPNGITKLLFWGLGVGGGGGGGGLPSIQVGTVTNIHSLYLATVLIFIVLIISTKLFKVYQLTALYLCS